MLFSKEQKDKTTTNSIMLRVRDDLPPFLKNYLPDGHRNGRPFVTLTYAQSIDAKIAKQRGVRTTISHIETKEMTHYLRYFHDGILIGSGTVLADDPGLNCKWIGPNNDPDESMEGKSPRPIILDPKLKWKYSGSKMEELCNQGMGKPPIVITTKTPKVKEANVEYMIMEPDANDRISWKSILDTLRRNYDMKSVMIEGGSHVINQLLMCSELIDSLIVTIGSIYLGSEGVTVSPPDEVKLKDISWWKGTSDVVMCSRLQN